MITHEYKCGSFTLRKQCGEQIDDSVSIAQLVLDNVEDCMLLGELGCAGNTEMYQYIYNIRTGKKYMCLLHYDKERLSAGHSVRFYPEDLTAEDIENLSSIGR